MSRPRRPVIAAALTAATAAATVLVAACTGGDAAPGLPDAHVYAAPYSLEPFTDTRITSRGGTPDFQRIRADIDLAGGSFASVTLIVDLASTCFPFEGWTSNPPPSGQRWPADCDAFDRNFEFTLDEPLADGDPPAFELVRAITPFGGPLHFEADMTDLANARPGAHRLDAFIATWSDGAGQVSGSDGGWNVSARIDVVPGDAPRRVLAAVPLFNGRLDSATAPEAIPFDVPEGATRSRVELRVTGHGGGAPTADCIGPAEEFCSRWHHVYLDDVEREPFVPWRSDCEALCTVTHYGAPGSGFDYCLENPCGNMSSVRAPRANWCPGSVTPALEWDAVELATPGPHTFRHAVDAVAAGGSWRVSATYYAFGD